jgi:hypothetical protein
LKIILHGTIQNAVKRCDNASNDLKNLAFDLSKLSATMKGFEEIIKANKDAKSEWMKS